MMRQKNGLPEIREDGGIATLYVNGEPFQAFAGEVHNSAAYDPGRMETEIWRNMEQTSLNTLIVPVYWETMEPEEGRYDFAQMDSLIKQAGKYGKKLILLWFGLWKNAESAYIPGWMKKDQERYLRVQTQDGGRQNTISPFCTGAVDRDATAFAALMSHLRETDTDRTVIMVQVENEVGFLGTPRDCCPQADEVFAGRVPEKLIKAWKKSGMCQDIPDDHGAAVHNGSSGTWKELFGEDAEEIFSAWYFARALEKITSAGKKEYPIPCYANVWLKQFPWYAGSYPSGGPVEDMLWVWKTAAPSLAAIGPDIYVPYVPDIMEAYARPDNPLVIPEVRKDAVTASYALYAFLHHHALCYGPFGIEDLWQEQPETLAPEVLEALKIDPLSFDLTGTKEVLGAVYRLLGEIRPLYLKYRGTEHLKCFLRKKEGEQGCYLRFQEYDMEIQYLPGSAGEPVAAGAVFELDKNRFLILGMMCSIRVHTKPGDRRKADFLKKEAGTFQSGKWVCTQRQNGDEKIVSILHHKLGCLNIEVFGY